MKSLPIKIISILTCVLVAILYVGFITNFTYEEIDFGHPELGIDVVPLIIHIALGLIILIHLMQNSSRKEVVILTLSLNSIFIIYTLFATYVTYTVVQWQPDKDLLRAIQFVGGTTLFMYCTIEIYLIIKIRETVSNKT